MLKFKDITTALKLNSSGLHFLFNTLLARLISLLQSLFIRTFIIRSLAAGVRVMILFTVFGYIDCFVVCVITACRLLFGTLRICRF